MLEQFAELAKQGLSGGTTLYSSSFRPRDRVYVKHKHKVQFTIKENVEEGGLIASTNICNFTHPNPITLLDELDALNASLGDAGSRGLVMPLRHSTTPGRRNLYGIFSCYLMHRYGSNSGRVPRGLGRLALALDHLAITFYVFPPKDNSYSKEDIVCAMFEGVGWIRARDPEELVHKLAKIENRVLSLIRSKHAT